MSEVSYIFMIDTDSYAGNFEREMTAYITGTIGQCGVGEQFISDFCQAFKIDDADSQGPFAGLIVSKIDGDDGCRRPCSIWESPESKLYNTVAIFLDKEPSKDQLRILIDRGFEYINKYNQTTKIQCFRVVRQEKIYTDITRINVEESRD